MTRAKAIQPEEIHVVIAAAACDERLALKLWRALVKRGVCASINDVHIFRDETLALVALISDETRESLEFSNQITSFRDNASEALLYACRTPHIALPPILSSERGEHGLLEPSRSASPLGMISDDQSSVRATADEILKRLGIAQPWPHWIKKPSPRAVIAGLAGALVLSLGVSVWSLNRDQTPELDGAAAIPLGADLLVALANDFPTDPSGRAVLRLAESLEAALANRPPENASAQTLTNQARLFHAIGEARDLHGDPIGAQAAFSRAHEMTGAALEDEPDAPERLFQHAQSAFWAGNSAYRAGSLTEAGRFFDTYAALSQRLFDIEPGNTLYQAELGHAANNRGLIALERGEIEEAIQLFDQAIVNFSGPPLQTGEVGIADIANTRGWRADALYAAGRLEEAAEERFREIELYHDANDSSSWDAETQWSIANAQYSAALALASLGNTAAAAETLEPAVITTARLTREHTDNIRYARLYTTAIRERARLAFWRGESIRAQLLLSEARNYISRVDEAGQNDARHLDRGLVHLLGAEIALAAGAFEDARGEATEAILAGEQGLSAGYSGAHELLAQAYFFHGEALLIAGDEAASRRAYRAAETHLAAAASPRHDFELLDLKARVLMRQDRTEEALAVRSELASLGYERADFEAFWSDADNALNADTSTTTDEGDDRG